MSLKVLYRDDNFIVVDKQCDLIINSCDNKRFSLQKQLSHQYPGEIKSEVKFGFYFPHRLDFATSGVMCIAVNKQACAAASSAFQSQSCQKFYVALLRGHVQPTHLEVNLPIGEMITDSLVENIGAPQRKMCLDEKNGRTAISRLYVLSRGIYDSLPATKVILRPLTGRRHQLRVHCHEIGHTIIGDYTYSNRMDIKPPRMFLHSLRLILPNKLANLDIQTDDPFSEVSSWTVNEICSEIPKAITSLQQEEFWTNTIT